MMVLTAGTCVKVASRATAGSASSQPWMCGLRQRGIQYTLSTVMAGRVPAIHVFAAKKDVDARHRAGHDEVKSMLISRQYPHRFRLRRVERRLRLLRAGQHRLQRIVERLGDALVVVGR